MSNDKEDYGTTFEEYEISEENEEALACEWDNYLNEGFDIFSVNNGLMTYDGICEKNGEELVNGDEKLNKISVDNAINFSFQNDTDPIPIQNDYVNNNYKIKKDYIELKDEINNNEKEDIQDVVNYNIFNGFSSLKISNDDENDSNVNAKCIIDNNLIINDNKINSNNENNEITIDRFDNSKILISNTHNVVNILSSIIIQKDKESQTDSISLSQSSNITFTLKHINRSLVFYHNETFNYNSIKPNKIIIPHLILNEISFEIILSNMCQRIKTNATKRHNDINIRYEYNDINQHLYNNNNENSVIDQYLIEQAYWFTMSNNIYHNCLRKKYENDDIVITKEISVYLSNTTSQVLIDDCLKLNQDNNVTSVISESNNRDSNSIQQLTDLELATMNHNLNNDNESHKNKRFKNTIDANSKPIMIRSNQSNHLSILISEEAFHSAKAQTINMPFESIANYNFTITNNNKSNQKNDNTSLKDLTLDESQIQILNKQLDALKYQNKLFTGENKKLLEVINIFKQLSTIDREKEKNKTNYNSKVKAANEHLIYQIEDNITHSNRKNDSIDSLNGIENRLNSLNNQCTIPLQIQTNHNSSNIKQELALTEYNQMKLCFGQEVTQNKPIDKRKKIVQQLESILNNVKGDNNIISQTDKNKLKYYQSLPLLSSDLNKKTTDSSNKNILFSNNTNVNQCNNNYCINTNNKTNKIPFHLISQRKLYENLIKSISIQKKPIKHYK